MKDTIDRPAAVRVLASVPAWKVPVVAMATPVDPIFTAIEAIASPMSLSLPRSTGPMDGRQHRKMVARSHKLDEDAFEAASGVEMGVPREGGLWRQS